MLEGAVQRAGDNVRINVQLIDAATDEHLWANTYDRRLSTDNLFAIQTEIATTIADKLKATLTPDEKERITKVPTENLQAYNLYLAGRQNLYQRKLENLQRARELFEQAIALDPKFAKAYSGLSDTLIILYSNFGALEPDVVIPKSKALLDKALALDPDDADIHASLGLLASTRWDVTSVSRRSRRGRAGLRARDRAQSEPCPGRRLVRGAGAVSAASTPTRSSSSSAPCSSTRWRASRRLNLGESYAGIGRASQGARHLARKRADEPGLARRHRKTSACISRISGGSMRLWPGPTGLVR